MVRQEEGLIVRCHSPSIEEDRHGREFVDSFKTELIADRVWRSRSQLELAIVEYLGWFNNRRLHESLGDIPPVELEQRHADRRAVPREPITLTTQSTRPN